MALTLIVRRQHARDLRIAPTADELHDTYGYDRGVCVAALQHLEEQKAAGTLHYYRPAGADFWNVWEDQMIDPKTGYRGVRLTLGDWTHRFIMHTLPSQQPQVQRQAQPVTGGDAA